MLPGLSLKAQVAANSDIRLGVTYTLPTVDFGEPANPKTFIPTSNGILTVTTDGQTNLTTTSGGSLLYTDAACSSPYSPYSAKNSGEGYVYKFAMIANTTY